MKRYLALAASTTVILGGATFVAPSAQAVDTRPCVTRAEYRAVDRGMLKSRVIRIWDGRGQIAEGGARYYRACGGGHVGVRYSRKQPRVVSKYRFAS